MRSLEKPPATSVESDVIEKSIQFELRPELRIILKKIEDEYLFWDKVKYLKLPHGVSPKDIWLVTSFNRSLKSQRFSIGGHEFSFFETVKTRKYLHEFDMRFGQPLVPSSNLDEQEKRQYLVSSLMEEAISSSQIEGAVTTRVDAKEMLRQQRTPKNRSEKMILNNYRTIELIRQVKDKPLTIGGLLTIQQVVTNQTLDKPENEGAFRKSDDVAVVDTSDNEEVYRPPAVKELQKMLNDFCLFFNEEPSNYFLHPVIKASIIHFLIGYIHPFVDGNGRTARALFYYYMLRHGYWLTEYLSISSVILKTKTQYDRAYLHTEADGNDTTYFINYQVKVLKDSYEKLQEYLTRKLIEKRNATQLLLRGGINDRQAKIIKWFSEDASKVVTVKEIETVFSISNQTARNDLQQLVDKKWLISSFINKKKQIFSRSNSFVDKLTNRQ